MGGLKRKAALMALLVLLALLGLPSHELEAAPANRVALVIGNDAYRYGGELNHAVSDAQKVGAALKALGFQVISKQDLDYGGLLDALDQLGKAAVGADWVVVYYAGHGIQVQGKNHLIPVDVKLNRTGDLRRTVLLDDVLTEVNQARELGLVVLDACRDNPFAARLNQGTGRSLVGRGLTRVGETGGNTLVAFATREDDIAADNGVYATILAKYLVVPDLEVRRLFGKVRDEVMAQTHNSQQPFTYGSLGGGYYVFKSGENDDKDNTNLELAFWNGVKDSRNPADLRAYLEQYPQGVFVKLAQNRLAELLPAPSPQSGQVFRDRLRDGSEGPALVVIGAGEFWMGSPESEAGREPGEAKERRHRVEIGRAFALGQTEVTVREFRRFVDASGYQTDAEKEGKGCYVWKDSKWQLAAGLNWRNPGFKQGDDHPVVCVSGNDALAYVKWLSQQTGQNYRLPSEAEWEYAARAGTTGARYWGEDPNRACGYANVADQTLGWTLMHECRDGYSHTAPVGTFQANAWKLNDMLGNVWEWTCSAYAEEYDGSESRCADQETTGPLAVRGGAWNNSPAWVRSASRNRSTPALRSNARGFRLARSL